MQHHGLFKSSLRQSKNKIGAAERKILIVFVYYVVVIIFTLLGATLRVRDREHTTNEIQCYFQCESRGVDPSNPCDTSGYFNLVTLIMSSISFILLGLFPLVNFIFVVNIRELKERCIELLLKKPIKPEEKNTTTSSNSKYTTDTSPTNTIIKS